MMLTRWTVAAGVVACCLGTLSAAGEWPQFRGPHSDGLTAESAIPTEWGPDKNVQWKAKIPGVAWSSPIVWGDKVFVTTAITDNQKKPPAGGGFGGGGPGGFMGFGGPPQPGQVLSRFLQDQLNLTADQKKQLEDLQKDVDGQVEKILTDEQKKQVKGMREGFGRGGPGGFGGPGRGGPGGFGGGKPPDVVYRWEIYCLDRPTGKVLWKRLALEGKPRIPTQQSNTYATETPVADGERIYAYFGMHGLFCYDFAGNLVWKKDFGSYPMQMGFGTASSPVLDGDRLFLQIDNEEKSFLVALNKKTGDEVWRVSRNEKTNWGSPVIWKNKLRTELVTPGSQKVRSYDPANGKVLWELSVAGQCNASPVGDSDLLYVGCEARFGGGGFGGGEMAQGRGGFGGGPGGGAGGGLYAVRAGASGDVSLKKDETSNAGVAWSQAKGGPEKASPLVYQGYVYVFRQSGGIVTCYDAKTGKQIYRERIPNAKSFWASPWAGEGKVFCLDDGGTTFVLKAGPEFKVLGKNSLNEMFWATPALAAGTALLRSVDNLYCIKAKEGGN
ncbi:MAG: PQQ-binding-like beta-propeller repeat protein [Gemmataceae bacterium]